MAGEYYRWLARDVKPEEKRELTKAEKRRNWWHYHQYHVLLGVVLLGIVLSLIWSALGIGQVKPDYAIAYVGSTALPEETVEALKQEFAALGRDENGDGHIEVAVNQYVSYATGDSDSLYYAQAAAAQLIADITACDSYFFLLEDPEGFQKEMHTLCYPDGTLPEDSDRSAEGMYILLQNCPALSGVLREENGDLALARRGFWTETETQFAEGCGLLWNKLIEGSIV